MEEYRRQMQIGAIQKAYRELMEYILSVKAYFKDNYPAYSVSGSLYFGYMDMTYFSIVPPFLKERNLKIAIVFLHKAFRFEAWLAAVNKQVQLEYWKLAKESGWDKYRIVPAVKGFDSIVECILVEDPDFAQKRALTDQIEAATLVFMGDIQVFLSGR